jgi:hypothetical protein
LLSATLAAPSRFVPAIFLLHAIDVRRSGLDAPKRFLFHGLALGNLFVARLSEFIASGAVFGSVQLIAREPKDPTKIMSADELAVVDASIAFIIDRSIEGPATSFALNHANLKAPNPTRSVPHGTYKDA